MAILQLLSQVLNRRKKCAPLPSKPRSLPPPGRSNPQPATTGPQFGDNWGRFPVVGCPCHLLPRGRSPAPFPAVDAVIFGESHKKAAPTRVPYQQRGGEGRTHARPQNQPTVGMGRPDPCWECQGRMSSPQSTMRGLGMEGWVSQAVRTRPSGAALGSAAPGAPNPAAERANPKRLP